MAHSFQNAGFDLKHPRIAKYLELCMRIQDLPRHLGQHSGGMVICQGQLNHVVPLERASMPGRTVVQWDKEDCADLGIIKVDLLGLGMMAVSQGLLELIPKHYGETVDLAQLPEDDDVYRTLQRADTVGMFQVESRAQMASLPRNHPEKFYDVVVQVAIIRPGPIVGKMMHPYMRRRQKKEEVSYPHPSLEPVLKRTLGVPLFQEQLAAHGDGGRQFYRRGGGGTAPRGRDAPLLGAHEKSRSQAARGHDGEWHRCQDAGHHHPEHQLVRSLRIPRVACCQLRSDRLCLRILQSEVSGGVHLRHSQQPADGFLYARCAGQGCAAAWPARQADRCPDVRLGMHDRARDGWQLFFAPRARIREGTAAAIGEALHRLASRMLGCFIQRRIWSARVPSLNRKELTLLARIGALNRLDGIEHRRDALWQVERAGKLEGPLLQAAERASCGRIPQARRCNR